MIKKFLKYIYLFILIELVIIIFLTYIANSKREVFLNKQFSMLNIQYNTTLNSYKDLATCFFNSVINKREVIKIFENAYLNISERALLRDKLFNLLNYDYEKIKNFGIVQLHFHFKNGISFLRFHKPEIYGDKLFSFRKSIQIINEKKSYLDGFEVGRDYGSYRFIFPIFNEKNEYFGSVELSLPFNLFMSKMNLTYSSYIYSIIKKDIFDKKIDKNEKKYFKISNLSEKYMVQKEIKIDNKNLYKYVDRKTVSKINLIIKDEIKDKLDLFKPFSISKYIDNKCYIVTFLPIKNIEANNIAYIISYMESLDLKEVRKYFLFEFIIFTLFNLMLIVFIYKISKTKELEEMKEKFEIIFDSANDGIVLVNSESSEFLMVNKRFCEMLGFNKSEIKNLTIFDIHPKSEHNRVKNDFKKLSNGEKVKVFGILVKRKDETLFYVDINASNTLKIKGIEYVVAIFRDISERVYFEDKLKIINRNLENRIREEVLKSREKDRIMFEQAKLAQMGEMLSMIAHQWRQPINAISAASININVKQQLGTLSDDFIIEQTDFIQKEAQFMSSIIDDFMNFFKSNKEKVEFKLVDSIEEVFNLMSAELNDKNIKYSYEVDENLKLYGYKSELEHVLINILSNARDILSYKEINEKSIKVRVNEVDELINIEIEDNGGGIVENIRDKVFNPYFSTKDEDKGLGLGLYMCKNIIENNFNGKIDFEVIDNKTIFSIKIKKVLNV